MAIQSMVLDPDAQSYTDNEIVAKINAATAQITRAASIVAAARPLASGEIKAVLNAEPDGSKLTSAELAAAAGIANGQVATGLAKANLDAMADTVRGYIKTDPTSGQFKVISMQRKADTKLEAKYDDVAV